MLFPESAPCFIDRIPHCVSTPYGTYIPAVKFLSRYLTPYICTRKTVDNVYAVTGHLEKKKKQRIKYPIVGMAWLQLPELLPREIEKPNTYSVVHMFSAVL